MLIWNCNTRFTSIADPHVLIGEVIYKLFSQESTRPHGVLLSLHRLIRLPENRILSLAGILVTQYIIFLGWLVFKVSDINNLEYCLSKFFIPTGFTSLDLAVGGAIISVLLLFRTKIANNDLMSRIGSFRPIYWLIYIMIAINLIYWASPVKVTKFIYAGF